MIFKVKREDFLKGLRTVEKAIFENKVKPIISCVYMEARERELFFCGTNLEMTIITTIPCDDVIAEGKIVFLHGIVQEYVGELKNEKITVSISENNLLIEGEDSSSEFALMDPDEYPKIPVDSDFDEKEESFKINSKELADLFDKIKFAASISNEKISMNCVRIESENNIIKFIATDAYRLAYLEYKIENISQEVKVSIPLVTVDSLVKVLRTNENKDVKFYSYDGKVFFKMEETLTISRVIDLEFHNYKVLLENNQYDKKLVMNAEEFNKILKRVIIFARNNPDSKYGAIFDFKGKEFSIDGANDLAQIKEILNVDYKGEDIIIGLNVKFILDFIQNLDKSNDVLMELANPNSFVRFAALDNENNLKLKEETTEEIDIKEDNIGEEDIKDEETQVTKVDAEKISDIKIKENNLKQYTYIVMPYAYKR